MGAGGDHGNRVLDLESLRRVDVLDLLALPFDMDGLVLVAQQHVSGALEEHVGGFPAGAGSGLDVIGDQSVDELQPRLLVFAAVALGRVRREQVPFGRSRTQRAGRDDLDSGCKKVVPVLDVLRIPLADHQGDHRSERDALGDIGIPVGSDLAGLDQSGDIRFDGEVHDVGGLTVDDSPGLIARGAIGGRHVDALAFRRCRKRRNDLAPAGFGNRIGHQGQGGIGFRSVAAAGDVAGSPTASGEHRSGGCQCRSNLKFAKDSGKRGHERPFSSSVCIGLTNPPRRRNGIAGTAITNTKPQGSRGSETTTCGNSNGVHTNA